MALARCHGRLPGDPVLTTSQNTRIRCCHCYPWHESVKGSRAPTILTCMHITIPDVVAASWMRGQWLVIKVITLLGWLDIRIIRSAHMECSVPRGSQSEPSIQSIDQWGSLTCDTGQSCRLSVILVTWELSTQHRSVSLLIIFLRWFIQSNENPDPEYESSGSG